MKPCYTGGEGVTLGHNRTQKDTVSCIESVSKQASGRRGVGVPCGRAPCSGPSGMDIKCGLCGHVADFEEFTRRPVSGDLPKGMVQCPKCGMALERRQGRARVLPSGFVMPGDVRMVEVGGVL